MGGDCDCKEAARAHLACMQKTPCMKNFFELECGVSEELQQKKMAEQRFENFQTGLERCTDEELERFERIIMERRGRATAPATAAPREDTPAPSMSVDVFMPSTIPELRGRENLGTFLERFRTWACLSGCDSALDSDTAVNTTGTSRAELEGLHEHSLVENSLKAWLALTKALEKEEEIMEMVMGIGSPSEAWRTLTKIASATQEEAYDRAKREFESLGIGVNEPVAEYFARVHVILMKLARHQVTPPAHEIQRAVLGGLTPRFPREVCLYVMQGELDLKELENGITRAESFESDQERWRASAHALAVAHAGGGRTGAGGGARGRGRHGRRSTKRHDDGRGRNQQQGHPQQMHPGQQQQPPPWQPQQQRRYPQSQQWGYPQSQQWGYPRHQQCDPWASWERPPPQQQCWSGAPHQRRRQHRGGDQTYWHQRRMCQCCGEEEHFPAECRATRNTPAPAPQHRPYSAPSSGAHVAQYGSCPPPPWTSHEYSYGHSIAPSYGPPPPPASYAPAPPMPSPPRTHGPPPPAPPSQSDWSFSPGYSQAL
ncbi:unnamed protein product [Ascophyllum nodosum]